jgi:phenylacetic acid degradation operon negative regulatory protein
VRLADGPGYALTPRAERRLDEAAARVYRTRPSTWDGSWHVVVLAELPGRESRERLASSLQLLGYGSLGASTWLAPRPSPELADVLAAEQVAAHSFHGPHQGDDVALATRAWDLAVLGADYAEFVARWRPVVSAVDGAAPAEAFAASQRLLHAWRKFLFRDPGLPRELLPPDWPGFAAAAFFDEHTARWAAVVDEFVDGCLAGGGRAQAGA